MEDGSAIVRSLNAMYPNIPASHVLDGNNVHVMQFHKQIGNKQFLEILLIMCEDF